MIMNTCVNINIEIKGVEDLHKLQPFMEASTLKINKSQIARELGKDRRTVDKYLKGFQKSKTRKTKNCLDDYYDIISDLLSDNNPQIFYYRRVLWQYLVDNHGYTGTYANFAYYIRKHENFNSYFSKRKSSNTKHVTVRYETEKGKQAQLDWKESIEFILSTGEVIDINIFSLVLSFSRFKIYRLSLSKSQEILLSFLDDAFATLGGVPKEIVTDNMKTVMDEARTLSYEGKVNNKFQQFADDYHFKVRPCIAGRPRTKAKVEAPMKLLDEIRAYNGKLNYNELNQLVERINDRVNSQVVQGTGIIPLLYYNIEKTSLQSIPADVIRKSYQLKSHTVKVNHSSMFYYKNCQYSVPPEYVGKRVTLQVYDNYIHVYYNTNLITIHHISKKRLNYHNEHYQAIALKSHVFKDELVADIAKENLAIIGDVYRYE